MNENINVLLVDDVIAVRESLIAYLEDFSFVVFGAGSLAEALTVLEEHSIHIAVLDLRLPDGNGESLARTILQRWPTTSCVFYTGSPDHQIPADLQEHPRIHPTALMKPIMDMDRFLELIRKLATLAEVSDHV